MRSWLWAAGLMGIVGTTGAQAAPLQIQVLDAKGQPLVGAVVALERSGQPERARAGARAEMAQKDRQFAPQILVVQTGTEVHFPNLDPVRHHVYSYSSVKSFERKLYLGEGAEPVLFDRPGVVTVGCNIHDRMSAHIVVVDTPVFGLTDERGQLSLDAPAGGLTLQAWHPSRKDTKLHRQVLPPSATSYSLTL
ncbi:plastocyanin [Inhella inkyongensis]|uniref:Plastocyanin n=1 Tax=Inhella inkyongensis TaxID=392593 RepID=A0A840S382_9BURK|nr:methylamine utilization protein [Inhella inkyongensis]MBB5203030.1 plastocyanin [Inhella inkyongensis]